MGRTTRVLLFLGAVLLLFVCFGLASGRVFPDDTPRVVILTSLVTMTFIAFFVEHYFETPSTVMATAVSAVLLLVSARTGLSELGLLLWVFVGWCLVLIALSSAALMLLPQKADRGTRADHARVMSARLKRLATDYGNARLVFGLVAATTAATYLTGQPLVLALSIAYTVVLLGLDTHRRRPRQRTGEPVVGTVAAVEPGNVVRVEVSRAENLAAGDAVTYKLYGDGDGTARAGVVATSFRTLEGAQAVVLGASPAPYDSPLQPLDVARRQSDDSATPLGLVAEGSSISVLKVDTLALSDLSEGSLLAVDCAGSVRSDTLYQVFDASVCSRGERAVIVADAVQLGIWDEAMCGFRRQGWVPAKNSLVRSVEGSCCSAPPGDSIVLGHLPGTEYPVVINRAALRGGHLAILGLTGCGKSVTARYLLRELAGQNHRIIVIDLTGEYRRIVMDPEPTSVVSAEAGKVLRDAVRDLTRQMAEFPNRRDDAKVLSCQKQLDDGFRDALQAWLASEAGAYALLELPGFENTANSLEYTRWFLRTLFDIARKGGLGGQSVTVALEEAHTVVPEWNFAGAKGDKAAEGLLNSIAQIALQGRKYGIGFVVIAQRTANVSKTVLTQCSSVIAFRSYDNTSADFLSNYIGDDLSRALSNLADREAIVVGSAFRSQVPLICRVLDVDEGGDRGERTPTEPL